MAPKKNRKPVQESLVEEPTPDFDVPFEGIREEEQEDSEDQKNHDDHENEEE